MVNGRVKRAERGRAGAAEQVFRTRELMQSGPVAESESRVARNSSTFSGAKDRNQEQWSIPSKYLQDAHRPPATPFWLKHQNHCSPSCIYSSLFPPVEPPSTLSSISSQAGKINSQDIYCCRSPPVGVRATAFS